MPSQFFGLHIAYSGLTAANVGLNTTGNNISNVETNGYSRQRVQQRASDALRTFTTYGCAGAGVDTIAIERMRDEFYDVKYWNNNKATGEYDKKQYYMKQIEDYFADDGKTVKGFNSIFDEMYLALAEVKKYAGDPTKKTQFVSTAQALADYFKGTSGNLQKAQQDINSEIKIKTDQINSLAEGIATLNKQINTIEMQGCTANELRDRRAVLVDTLSSIVDITTEEIPIVDSNNQDRLTGGNRYVITIAGGQSLVDMGDFNTLECVPRNANQKVNQSDVDGLYDIKWKNGSSFGMHSPSLGGELKGLIDMRDGNNGVNFSGTVKSVGTVTMPGDPDDGKKTVRVDVTKDELKSLDKSTLPDTGGMINIGGQLFQYDSWSFTTDTTTTPPTYAYDFVLSATNKTEISSAKVGRSASIGESVDYQGIPYYMQQMNEWVREFAAAFNGILQQPGAVSDGGYPGEKLFTGNDHKGNQLEFPGTVPYNRNGTVKSSDDSYYRLTASNFAITTLLKGDASRLATHTGESEGESKYNVLDDLVDLRTNKNRMNFRGGSAEGFLQTIWTDTSLNAFNANTFYKNSSNISKTISTQRQSVSGVDKDEEAVNLVKYQNSYTLASKMIQTLTEIYDRLILQTGV